MGAWHHSRRDYAERIVIGTVDVFPQTVFRIACGADCNARIATMHSFVAQFSFASCRLFSATSAIQAFSNRRAEPGCASPVASRPRVCFAEARVVAWSFGQAFVACAVQCTGGKLLR